jgi:hypothetical protein
MQGASTATAEIMVFRFMAEITISAVATNPFNAEDTIPRISEA